MKNRFYVIVWRDDCLLPDAVGFDTECEAKRYAKSIGDARIIHHQIRTGD